MKCNNLDLQTDITCVSEDKYGKQNFGKKVLNVSLVRGSHLHNHWSHCFVQAIVDQNKRPFQKRETFFKKSWEVYRCIFQKYNFLKPKILTDAAQRW